jgi:hypothetical protein
MKTEEGNKLIADLVGAKYLPENDVWDFGNSDPFPLVSGPFTGRLRYHYSWDWLMPVVEKIEATDDGYYDVRIMGSYCEILTFDGDVIVQMSEGENPKITATWMAVVKFIEWYNTQKKTA